MFDVRISLLLELEDLQPIVSRIHSDDAIFLIHRDAPRVGQLSRLVPARAPHAESLAGLLVDQLHAVVAELANDKMSLVILVQSIRIPELARPRADLAHR